MVSPSADANSRSFLSAQIKITGEVWYVKIFLLQLPSRTLVCHHRIFEPIFLALPVLPPSVVPEWEYSRLHRRDRAFPSDRGLLVDEVDLHLALALRFPLKDALSSPAERH